MSKNKNVLICGSIAFDTITLFEGYFKDYILEKNIHSLSVSFFVPTMRKELGGCAGNIAYNLKLLGGSPIPVATVGKDFDVYQRKMQQLGISIEAIRVFDDAFTAQCHITTDMAGNQITAFHPGAMIFSAQNDISNLQAIWGIVAPDSKDGMFAHATKMAAMKLPFIFDLGQAMPLFQAEDLNRMIALSQALTANDYEALVIQKLTGQSMEQLSEKMQAVVVTRGVEGADLYRQGQKIKIEPVRASVVQDPTGCGDAHRAGLLYGLSEGWSWEDGCRLGNVMGAIKVASQGPQNHIVGVDEIKQIFMDSYGYSPWH